MASSKALSLKKKGNIISEKVPEALERRASKVLECNPPPLCLCSRIIRFSEISLTIKRLTF
jgi:hypothetical protein